MPAHGAQEPKDFATRAAYAFAATMVKIVYAVRVSKESRTNFRLVGGNL